MRKKTIMFLGISWVLLGVPGCPKDFDDDGSSSNDSSPGGSGPGGSGPTTNPLGDDDDLCKEYCENVLTCDEEPEEIPACVAECESVLAQSHCLAETQAFYGCLGGLDCAQLDHWWEEDPMPYPCQTEEETFDDCWYNVPDEGGGGGSCGTTSVSCDACFDCAMSEGGDCAAQTQACGANSACVAIINCLGECSGDGCIDQCVDANPGGQEHFWALMQCLFDTCETLCE